MYLMREKSNNSLYRNYRPKYSRHKEAEIEAYIAYAVGNDISRKMKSSIGYMSSMIVKGFFKRGN